ncbi:hypothetical protein [Actinoplanes sp. DH11]|uniref:hypothetical protein n=1 Tax=Actinoplanes sp. DH11 TaxID=2857011 RepID=UPI001E33F316|nr:hypothetical protein [Actinoplanes sp. DH11]
MTGVPEIEKPVLGALRRLGDGGQGSVWATDSIKINGSWPGVYKEYDAAVLPRLDIAQLRRMVSFVPSLPMDRGRWLCEQTAWPAALVREHGAVRGFLMRRIPPEFETSLPQRSGAAVRRPAGFQYLLNHEDYLRRIAVRIDDRTRLLLLADLAETLAELHRLGIAVGDLSPNNLLFHLAPGPPRSFFIDCDAMRLAGSSVLPQAETTAWEVPAGEELGTAASDAYKFGLVAIRLFAGDQDSRDHTVLGPASGELAAMALRSQSPDPAARPAPGAWAPLLRTAATSVTTVLAKSANAPKARSAKGTKTGPVNAPKGGARTRRTPGQRTPVKPATTGATGPHRPAPPPVVPAPPPRPVPAAADTSSVSPVTVAIVLALIAIGVFVMCQLA